MIILHSSKQAQKREFTELDNIIRDKIVFSIQEKTLKERPLRERDLTLAKTIMLCKAAEITHKKITAMRKPPQCQGQAQISQKTVDYVKKKEINK